MEGMTPEEQKWDDVLRSNGLSMSRGRNDLDVLYEHLLRPEGAEGAEDDEDGDKGDMHCLDWAKQGAKTAGGKLLHYEIGQRISHRTHCLRCGNPLTAKRAAKYCNKKCRQRRPALPERPCQNCGDLFQPQRSNARYHPECIAFAYRKRQRANIDTCAGVSRKVPDRPHASP